MKQLVQLSQSPNLMSGKPFEIRTFQHDVEVAYPCFPSLTTVFRQYLVTFSLRSTFPSSISLTTIELLRLVVEKTFRMVFPTRLQIYYDLCVAPKDLRHLTVFLYCNSGPVSNPLSNEFLKISSIF